MKNKLFYFHQRYTRSRISATLTTTGAEATSSNITTIAKIPSICGFLKERKFSITTFTKPYLKM